MPVAERRSVRTALQQQSGLPLKSGPCMMGSRRSWPTVHNPEVNIISSIEIFRCSQELDTHRSPLAGPKVAAILSVVESRRRLKVPVRNYFSAILTGLPISPSGASQTLLPLRGSPDIYRPEFSHRPEY
jgi:hypothetical protein